jgi:hypothetical protein
LRDRVRSILGGSISRIDRDQIQSHQVRRGHLHISVKQKKHGGMPCFLKRGISVRSPVRKSPTWRFCLRCT